MKRDRVEWLLGRLRNEVKDEQFHMTRWLASFVFIDADNRPEYDPIGYVDEEQLKPCRTAGCLAGAVFLGLIPERRAELVAIHGGPDNSDLVKDVAKDELGLDAAETHALFQPFMSQRNLGLVTRQMAIQLLENLLANAVIDWTLVVPADMIPYATSRVTTSWD